MQKVTLFFLSVIMLPFLSFTKTEKEAIKWLSIAEMQLEYKKKPKPILVDVYTNWCGWCKVMDKQTYGNDNVAAYINEKYYAVKFDAESRESVEWNGKKYEYNRQNKLNDMAVYLMSGQMSFPTTVFLTALDSKPAPLAGYLKPREIESLLKFFGDEVYKTKNFPEYRKTFSASW